MKPSMRARLEQLALRLSDLNTLLSSPDSSRDAAEFRRLHQEHAELTQAVDHYDSYRRAQSDLVAAEQMLSDPELAEFAAEECARASERSSTEVATLERLLLPKDPNDSRNVFLEIRAGTGGDESALFAGDLLRMYTRYAELQGWKVELVSESASELGGYREVIVRIAGDSVYEKLKFESGVHRVQRVPETEAQGRIHTSACTVAVLPEADEVGDIDIDPDELRIDVYRSSGAGGQHVNKTESAVRITHLPTGIVVECQDDRSQHRNRDRAMTVLRARLLDRRTSEAHEKEAAHRKSLVGSGDRSERIRTYNFPQGRVTDHRVNLTLYKIDRIIGGELDEIIDGLTNAHQAELLAELDDVRA